jgi:hypothetical protein
VICPACYADIFFVGTEASNGEHSMPLDRGQNGEGNVVLIRRPTLFGVGPQLAHVLTKADRALGRFDNLPRWMPHFKTCAERVAQCFT